MRKISTTFLIAFMLVLANASSASAGVIGRPTNNLGLAGYWSFNEGSGTTVGDSSGNRYTGTFSGSPSPAWVNGKFGTGLYFPGQDLSQHYVQVKSGAIISGQNSWTISAWVNIDNNFGINGSAIYSERAASGNDIVKLDSLDGNHPNNAFITIRDDAGTLVQMSGTVVINDGRWHQIVGVKNGSALFLYVDGVLDNSGAWGGTNTFTNAGITSLIGGDIQDPDADVEGNIDEVRVYKRPLSAAEVATLYKTGSSRVGVTTSSLDNGNLSNGLVGHWTFDNLDVTDKVYDKSGQGNNGYFNGGATSSAKKVGKLGQALYFNGFSTVNVPDNASLDVTSAISFGAWFKANSIQVGATGPSILSKQDSSGINLEIDETGSDCGTTANYLCGSVRIGGTYYNVMGPFTFNVWHHAMVTYSGSNIILYIDGVQVDQNAQSGAIVTNTLPFCIGGNTSASGACTDTDKFTGSIDDARVYNRALSAAEVKQLYNLGGGKLNAPVADLQKGTSLATGLVGHWTFDNLDVTDKVYDRSGQANNGYYVGAATSSGKVPGKLGQAINFNGTSAYIDAGSSATLGLTSGAFTVSAWTNVRSAGQQMFVFKGLGCSIWATWLFSIGGNESGGFSGKYFLGFGDGTAGTTQNVASISNATPNQWAFVTGVYNGSSQLSLYINGVLDNTASVTGNPASNAAHTFIGADPGCGVRTAVNGSMDDMRIYNRALSASEVRQLYNLGR